jgi:hypothetical protein
MTNATKRSVFRFNNCKVQGRVNNVERERAQRSSFSISAWEAPDGPHPLTPSPAQAGEGELSPSPVQWSDGRGGQGGEGRRNIKCLM